MDSSTKAGVGLAGAFLAAWTAWGLYSRQSAESIPYEVAQTVDGLEIRRYPRTVLVETTAPDQITAFRRLFDYISGANAGAESISMTTPVETVEGERLAMTSPVRSDAVAAGDGIRMGFYLPIDYSPDRAPEPTDSTVRLVVEPPRTLGVLRFSWYAPEWRVRRAERKLLGALEANGIERVSEPTLLRYNDPWTPPYLRRNEVAVEITEEA